jgi:hypothetical protein
VAAGVTPSPSPPAPDLDAAWSRLLDRYTSHLGAQRTYLERLAAGEADAVAPGAFDAGTELPAPPAALRPRLTALRHETDELQVLSRALLATVTVSTRAVPRPAGPTGGAVVDRAL